MLIGCRKVLSVGIHDKVEKQLLFSEVNKVIFLQYAEANLYDLKHVKSSIL